MTGPGPRTLTRAFPRPGPLLELAFRELAVAAEGSPERVRALGDLEGLPRPWDPPSCPTELRAELWSWLDEVVDWLNTDYTWDVTGIVPACWPQHSHLVHEIAVVADQRRRAGQALTSDPVEEWHRYTLPSFVDRMRSRLRTHCEEGHQTWPARGRHARHADPAVTSHRDRLFSDDLRDEPGGPGTAGPRLVLLDTAWRNL